MEYTFKCPVCGEVTRVEAENDEQAVDLLMAQGAQHGKDAGHDMSMSEDEMRDMVKNGMQKGAEAPAS